MVKLQDQKIFKLFLFLIGICLLLLGLDKLQLLNGFKSAFAVITNPARISLFNLGKNSSSEAIILDKKIELLELENANLKIKIDTLEQENLSMKKMLGAPLPATWKFTPAKVLSIKDNVMFIDQGSEVGIKAGHTVVFENHFLGIVKDSVPFLSKILLLGNKELIIKAKILEINAKGEVRTNPEGIVIDNVAQENKLEAGQTIITSGEEENVKPNLVIGKITQVEKEEAAIYQQAKLEPILNPAFLTDVFIIQN